MLSTSNGPGQVGSLGGHGTSGGGNATSGGSSSSGQRPLRLRRVNHSDEIISGFARLLKSESMADVTLICAGGQAIRAHKVILSMFSPYFKTIFEAQPFINNPNQYPVIVVKDLGLLELRTIVEFIYKGEVSVPRDKLPAILSAAKALEVSGLADLKSDPGYGGPASSMSSPNSSEPATSPTPGSGTACPSISSTTNFASSLGALGSLGGSFSAQAIKRAKEAELFGSSDIKKLRITQDGNGNDVMDITGGGGGNVVINEGGIDGVRSLLQQPSRIPAAFHSLRQQQQLQQQYQQMQKQRQLSLQQYMQQRQLQQKQQQLQQRQLQLQQHMKNQILQQQLLQKGPSRMRSGNGGSSSSGGSSGQAFAEFQQRIKAQLKEKQRLNASSKLDQPEVLNLKKESDSDEKNDEEKKEEMKEGEEVEGVEEEDKGDKEVTEGVEDEEKEIEVDVENGDDEGVQNESKEGDDGENQAVEVSKNGGEQEEHLPEVEYVEDEEEGVNHCRSIEPVVEEDEEFEIEIDKDLVFQRQQQLRLQQLQKQQQYQQQMQLQLEQEEQEKRLLEFHKQLQAANMTSGGTGTGSGGEGEDSAPGFGFDWQDGFRDDGFGNFGTNAGGESPDSNKVSVYSSGSPNKPATPDFLQPRGPGRPRKGNKSQEISPCPECNKVFVRPDVLKLHYRSVHLNERHPCNMCPKIFKWPGDLSKHKRTKHGPPPEAQTPNR